MIPHAVIAHRRGRPRRRLVVLPIVLLVIIAGTLLAVFNPWKERGADDAFDTSVAHPALAARRPRVLYDEGHRNVHSASGRYRPFARLIESDGCAVRVHRGPFTAASLEGADVLVIVNAIGPGGDDHRADAAFTAGELDAIDAWIRGGGSLLLVADHYPCGPAAAALAARFAVQMTGGWTDDPAHARAGSGDPGQLVFTRDNGLLGEHAITQGASEADRVSTVETFTGQSLAAPIDSVTLLRLGDDAVDRIPTGSTTATEGSTRRTTFTTDDLPARGHCQGLALHAGKGRVVVLAEAAMLTAQVDPETGTRFGMNAPGNDNRQFALNVVRWLVGGDDGRASPRRE